MWTRAALAILLLAAAPAGATADEKAFASLDGTFWRIAEPPQSLEEIAVGFHDGVLMQTTPCAIVDHQFQVHDGTAGFYSEIKIATTSSKDCDPKIRAFEEFGERLKDVKTYRRKGERLVLVTANGEKLAFERIVPGGIEYRWFAITAYRHAGKMTGVLAYRETPTLLLVHGHMEGSSGCSIWTGGFTAKGGDHYDIASEHTVVDCAGDKRAERQESRIVRAFDGSRHAKALPMGEFELRDDKGNVQIILSPLTKGGLP